MDLKFIILMIGLFLFVIGYVNQNKYNCNIIPTFEKKQHQFLNNLFGKSNIEINTDLKDYDLKGNIVTPTSAIDLGIAPQDTMLSSGGVSVAISGSRR